MDQKRLTHLRQLEAESIHIIREVAAEFSNPVMLYLSVKIPASCCIWRARRFIQVAAFPVAACRYRLEIPRDV